MFVNSEKCKKLHPMIVKSLRMWLPLQGVRHGTVQDAEEPSAHRDSLTPEEKKMFFNQDQNKTP